ncbi:serine/threonine protein kinase [Exiguobacterium sp. TDN 0502]|uniref:serine/threonine protein kinase n=1 Tax=Exiguobacterium sp. TDN 0502 TaxID=3420731 RepID=UPI003D7881ED
MKTDAELAKRIELKQSGATCSIESFPDALDWIGTGRSAYVFRIRGTDRVIKKFFPSFRHLAALEGGIYEQLTAFPTYATMYEYDLDYIVLEYIEGQTLFECLVSGTYIPETVLSTVDAALTEARAVGLNPSDIHLRNILLTANGPRIIDVARFRQTEPCTQWDDLKKAYQYIYTKPFFPKKLSETFLNAIADVYKGRLFESIRKTG